MSERTPPTRTPAFEARLKKRYAAERRFKLLGLGAILFSVAVLAILLANMTMNGLGGFQRTEVAVPIDFTSAGITADPALLSQPNAVQSLGAQGLPDIVQLSAEQALGADAAAEINSNAWREVAEAIIDEVSAALKGWQNTARQLGMSAADIAVYATAIQGD